HRVENSKIQSMKNAVPKNDKKRRKQLTEEIAKLEADLSQKHEEELRQLKSTNDTKVKTCIQMIAKYHGYVLELHKQMCLGTEQSMHRM
uniref:Uncharacterized protein n=1 Tax=Seriola lalandi dorsalis TaxID=1841481 RepID=A0A3B4X1E3_SERLL